jgi:hypothetical protein
LPEDRIRSWEPHAAASPKRPRRWEPYGFIGESMVEDAWIAEWNGGRYVCPRRPHLRVLEGVLGLFHHLEVFGKAVIIPEDVARQAERELRRLRATEPDIRSHILTSAWHVPVRWFVPFAAEDRIYTSNGSGGEIRYRTTVSKASERVNKAAEVMTAAGLPDNLITEINNLGMWLAEFPAESMVELDYGGVAEMFDPAGLAIDESAFDVWASLNALASGNMDEAGRYYAELMSRWAPAFAVSFSN